MIKKIANNRRYLSLSKYFVIGVIWSLLTIFLMWIVIDLLGVSTLIGSSAVVLFIVVTKYFAYRIIRFMKKGMFLKYILTTMFYALANIFLMWLFVDTFLLSAVISSTMIVIVLYLLRYFTFEKLNLLKK